MGGTWARNERWIPALVALAAAAVGIGFRGWQIFAEPLWLDEAYSAFAAGKDFAFLWHVVPRYETHPPFYYTLLHLWEAPFGDSLIALRSLGLIAGLATPPVLGWCAAAIARRLGWDARRRAWLVALTFAFACLSFPLIEMTREVRPYPLIILVYALAIRALLGVAERGLRSRAYAAYLLCLTLLLWLHNLGPLWGMALGLALLVTMRWERGGWLRLVGGHAIVALLYLPALAILLDQAPTWVAKTWLQFSWTGLWSRVAMLYTVPGWQGLTALALAILAAIALWPRDRRLLAMLLILALVPLALSIALSVTIAPVFITRTMTPVAVPTLLLLAIGAAGSRPVWLGPIVAFALAANLIAVDIQVRANGPMQDWYRAVAWLQRHVRPGDRILAYPNEGALPMERALRDKGLDWPVDPIPAPVPALGEVGTHPTGSRGVLSLSPERLHAIAQSPTVKAIPTIWLLRLGEKTYDPGDVMLHEIAAGRRFAGSYTDSAIKIAGWRRK